MCDYSLMGFPNRLAEEGEELVVHRFPTNSLGLISASNITCAVDYANSKPSHFWTIVKSWFDQGRNDIVAVCVPPGTQLLLRDLPAHLRDYLKIGHEEEVVFTQITANADTYRDTVRFRNGRELLLQHLIVGQRAKVLYVPVDSRQDENAYSEHLIRANTN